MATAKERTGKTEEKASRDWRSWNAGDEDGEAGKGNPQPFQWARVMAGDDLGKPGEGAGREAACTQHQNVSLGGEGGSVRRLIQPWEVPKRKAAAGASSLRWSAETCRVCGCPGRRWGAARGPGVAPSGTPEFQRLMGSQPGKMKLVG